MIISKDTADIEFNKLSNNEKNLVVDTLINFRVKYKASGVDVDIPYFFWSIHSFLFDNIDPTDFLNAQNKDQFVIEVVYYISKYIRSKNV